jgi:hypothetical protein
VVFQPAAVRRVAIADVYGFFAHHRRKGIVGIA